MTRGEFYYDWCIRRTFFGPFCWAQGIQLLLSFVLGAVSLRWPALGGELNPLLWIIPLAVFVATSAIVWVLAPYAMYRELESSKDASIAALSIASVGDVQEFLCGIADKADAIIGVPVIQERPTPQELIATRPTQLDSNEQAQVTEWYAELSDGLRQAVRSHHANKFLDRWQLANSKQSEVRSIQNALRKLAKSLTPEDIVRGFDPGRS